jgi:uncharacterized damage-inducible protein DinB
MRQTPWTAREFRFEAPAGLFPGILERIRGTPARLAARVSGLPTGVLVRRDGDSWSIQENVGHLIEVEALWLGRLDDYDAGLRVLRAADMQNRRTSAANYNSRSIAAVLEEFGGVRGRLVERLEGLDDGMIARTALHPRLNTPMRIVDMMIFAAEHDDHHLARITELMRLSGARPQR